MAELIRYLLLANIFLLVLSLFFQLVLAKERRFRLNRVVLLSGVVLALLVPIFQLDLWATPENALILIPETIAKLPLIKADFILEEIQIYGTAPKVFPWVSISQILYIGGIIFTGILFTLRLKHLRQLQKSSPMRWIRDLFVSILPKGNSPFSFFGVVYFPEPLDIEDKATTLILEHERAHILQRHSWDIVFIEILKILFFYNPAVYTLKKQLELTHEFLADSAGAAEDVHLYSLTLFKSLFHAPEQVLSHAYKKPSSLRQRIEMLNQRQEATGLSLKYLLLIPLTAGFITLSSLTIVLT